MSSNERRCKGIAISAIERGGFASGNLKSNKAELEQKAKLGLV
jgi:hypothetical protein